MGKGRFLGREERLEAIRAHERGKLFIHFSPKGGAYEFAKKHGWPTPFFGSFKKAFMKKMLESDENFKLAMIELDVDVYVSYE
jgi:hypothetical protein